MKSFSPQLTCCIVPLLLRLIVLGSNNSLVVQAADHEEDGLVLQLANVTVELSSGSMTFGPDAVGTSSIATQGDDFEIVINSLGFFSNEVLNYTWEEHFLWNDPDNLDGTNVNASYYGYVFSEDVPDTCYSFDPSSHIMFMNRTVDEEGWTRTCWIFSTGDPELNEQLHDVIVMSLLNETDAHTDMDTDMDMDTNATMTPPAEQDMEPEADSAMSKLSMLGVTFSSLVLLFGVTML